MTPPSPIQTLLTQWREAAEKATNGFDTLRKILRERTKGEVNTWGFVALFMDMIDEAEKATLLSRTALPTAIEMLEVVAGALEKVEDLLAFHEGSGREIKPGGNLVVWVNNDDLNENLATLRTALSALQALADRRIK